MPIVIKLRKAVDVVPSPLVVCVENMRAVLVEVDARVLEILRVAVAGNMRPRIENKNRLSGLLHLLSKHSPVDAGADDHVVVFLAHENVPSVRTGISRINSCFQEAIERSLRRAKSPVLQECYGVRFCCSVSQYVRNIEQVIFGSDADD